ncbi:ribbon-helix-helix protein, CopG family [Pleomorphovibrio marinus]|uniref:ribbon-helix-helix protein, CopG family n=1 Tax=Pleomorphovibrio marinus TaxID=2164132 RepID=UPI000E0B009C|nr:ribbon-helix-helix protein, CopG family [Pleomorphovibrio marinus]
MLNVRLDKEMEKRLKEISRVKSMTKSDIVKEALAEYLTKEQLTQSAYELGKDLFGAEEGGLKKASSQFKQMLKERLYGKHPH